MMQWPALIEALRPRHWVKSGFCTAALFFSGLATELSAWLALVPGLVAFSLLSSAGYLVNDLVNCEEDQKHPLKRKRPIPSGRLSRRSALYSALLTGGAALALGYFCYKGAEVVWTLLGYLALSLAYTFFLRSWPYLDVFALSLGFVLRVCAGAFAIGVTPSSWLILLTYLVSLLLAFGKRRGELRALHKKDLQVGTTRASLRRYEGGTLALLVNVLTFLTVAAYLAFCFVVKGGGWFLLTALPVTTGLFSYVREVGCSERVEVPEKMVFQNRTLLTSFLVWAVLVLGLPLLALSEMQVPVVMSRHRVLVLLGAALWIILMVWACQGAMRESDQASLLRGAIALNGADEAFVPSSLHNYSGQYGSYWLLAWCYEFFHFGTLEEWVTFGNAAACYPFLLVVGAIALLRRRELSLLWLIGLTAPTVLLSVPLLASNILAGTAFLVFLGLNRVWHRWWGALLAGLACFAAVCLRQDVVLLLPLACLLSSGRSSRNQSGEKEEKGEWRTLIATRQYYVFGAAAGGALLLGTVLSGGERYLPTSISDVRLIAAYTLFGLGGTGLALGVLVFQKHRSSRLYSLAISVAALLPLAFYLPMLYSPRHLFVCALVPLVFALSPRHVPFRRWQQAALGVALVGNVLWLCVGVVLPKVEGQYRAKLSVTDSLWYPTADGLWPTGAGLSFLSKLRHAAQEPIDHNQEVWALWAELDPAKLQVLGTISPRGPLRAYGNLWLAFHSREIQSEGRMVIVSDREVFGTGGRSQQNWKETVQVEDKRGVYDHAA